MIRTPILARRFRRDHSGATAVEFALISPILIGLYFGMAEYCQAMLADRRATHVASVVGDLVAQSESTSATELDDILTIGPSVMAPFKSTSATPLKIRVTSVKKDSTGKVSCDWARGTSPSPAAYNVASLPTAGANSTQPFLANGQSVIVAQAEYSYTAPFDLSLIRKLLNKNVNATGPSTYNFSEIFYLRPRKSVSIACTGCTTGC